MPTLGAVAPAAIQSRGRQAEEAEPLPLIIVKVAGRCNLDCLYCYEFNLADQGWRSAPKLMSAETFEALLERVRRHCEASGQTAVNLSMHGGEPCLVGVKRFSQMCRRAREVLRDIEVRISLQTNGTLLDRDWAQALRDFSVNVGISLDGPQAVNDLLRVDRRGRGSHRRVVRGLEVLAAEGVEFGLLTVIPLGADPIEIHHHFLSLGARSMSYLLPDFTHDTFGDVHRRYGDTPCADFLIPIFDDWWVNGTIDIRIRNFWDVGRLIMGGRTHVDALGNAPLRFMVVNTAGDIEGLDVLKACGDAFVKTGLNVHEHDFADVRTASPLHAKMIFDSLPLPRGCRGCPEQDTCAGGYHPHRYSAANGFDNPSVWCADLLKLFGHIRLRLDVAPDETRVRRRAVAREEPLGVRGRA